MKKNLALTIKHLTLVALMVLTFSACSKNPNPLTPSPNVAVVPSGATNAVPIFAGAQQEFTATGCDPKCTWSVTGGGTVAVLNGATDRAVVTAGQVAGTFQVTASNGTNQGASNFVVVVQRINSVNLVSATPPPGTDLIRGVVFVVDYTTSQDGLSIRIKFYDKNSNPVGSGGDSPALNSAGRVTLQASAAPGITAFADVVIYRVGGGFEEVHFRFPMEYHWG